MRILNAHLCERVEEDSKTGNESIFGIFTHIHVPSLPAIVTPGIVVYTFWEGELEEKSSISIVIKDPSGKIIRETRKRKTAFTKRYKTITWFLRKLKIVSEGEHVVIIRGDEGDMRRLPITVVVTGGMVQ